MSHKLIHANEDRIRNDWSLIPKGAWGRAYIYAFPENYKNEMEK
jgi:hypothetical protein